MIKVKKPIAKLKSKEIHVGYSNNNSYGTQRKTRKKSIRKKTSRKKGRK